MNLAIHLNRRTHLANRQPSQYLLELFGQILFNQLPHVAAKNPCSLGFENLLNRFSSLQQAASHLDLFADLLKLLFISIDREFMTDTADPDFRLGVIFINMFVEIFLNLTAGNLHLVVHFTAEQLVAQDLVFEFLTIGRKRHPLGFNGLLQLVRGKIVLPLDIFDGGVQFPVGNRQAQLLDPLFHQFFIDQLFQNLAP